MSKLTERILRAIFVEENAFVIFLLGATITFYGVLAEIVLQAVSQWVFWTGVVVMLLGLLCYELALMKRT